MWRVAANILNKSGEPTWGHFPAWDEQPMLKIIYYDMLHRTLGLDDFFWNGLSKMDMKFDTWNTRSLCKAGSVTTIARETEKYELDLVSIKDVRWDGGGSEPAGDSTFLYGNWNENHELEQDSLFAGESYQQLRGWSFLVIGYRIQ
jgi:hypothetical protein